MALGVTLLTFTKPTAGAPPVTQESASLGYTPKGAFAWHANTSAASYAEGYAHGFGFSDGTNHRCMGGAADDNAATSNTGFAYQQAFIVIPSSTSGTVVDEATVSFGADTITLSWNTRSANAATIFVLVFGGTDVTNVTVGQFTAATVTGDQTTTGTSFTPDCEFYIATDNTTSEQTGAHAPWTLGAGMSTSKEWLLCGDSEDAQTAADTWRFQNTTNVVGRLGASAGSIQTLAGHVAFTATGRTVNWSAADSSAKVIYFIAIKGAQMDMGSFTVTAGTGNFSPVTTMTFTPSAILLLSTGGSTSVAASEANNRFSVGCAISTSSRACVSTHDTDAAADMVNTKIHLTDKCFRLHTANATAGSSVTEVDIDLVSMDVAGFTLNKVTNSATLGNELVMWWAIGATAVAAGAVEDRRAKAFNAQQALLPGNQAPIFG